MIFTPRPYQTIIGDFILNHERCNVWAGMGMGKTSESIAIFNTLRIFGESDRALVIAPKRVAVSTWPNEIVKWHESFGHLSIVAAVGTPAQRIDAIKRRADITCINYENLEWLVEIMGDYWCWDTVIADECFVSGTQVLTPAGSVDIETLKAGDLVNTSIGPKKVVRLYEKSTRSLIEVRLIDGTRIVCTPSHLFWTDSGWEKAERLHDSTTVFAQMPVLRKDVCNPAQSCNSGRVGEVLQSQLLDKKLDSEHFAGEVAGQRSQIARMAGSKSELECRSSNAREYQVAAEPCIGRSKSDSGAPARREWQGHESVGTASSGVPREWVGVEPADTNKRGVDTEDTASVQTGFCMAIEDDLLGNRRAFSQGRCATGSGSEKRNGLIGVGVESVSHIECPSERTVWDIEVEDAHEYFAGGVLVHNCTRLKGLRVSLQTSSKGKEFVKGQGSVRAKALAQVAFTKVRRWISLTGSPAPNGVVDLYGQQWFIDRGQRLGSSFNAFRDRWFRSVPTSSGYTQLEPLSFAQKQIEDKLKDCTITVDAKDWFDIKAPIERIVGITLPPKARAIYDRMEKELFAEIETHEVEVFNAGGKSNKCLQIGSGAVYVDTETKQWVEVHDEKIDALKSIVAETNGEPLLVSYQYIPERERILKAFPKAVMLDKGDKVEKAWCAGKIPMLVVHPASAGHGLNLQDGGRILVDFSTGWNLEYDEQVIERIGPTRQLQSGHDRAVFRYRIVAEDTIEADSVLPRIKSKASVQESLKNAMKKRNYA